MFNMTEAQEKRIWVSVLILEKRAMCQSDMSILEFIKMRNRFLYLNYYTFGPFLFQQVTLFCLYITYIYFFY